MLIEVAEVVDVEDAIRTKSPTLTVLASYKIPDVAVDLEVRIWLFVPTGSLDLDDPSCVRISPFALTGLRLISPCVGIITP
jgi:hypothetical protein